MNKKGNINQLFPAVLALILVGALLTVGIMILTSFQDTAYLNTAGTILNESIATPNMTGVTLASASLRNGACGAATSILNGTTGNYVISLTNFSQTDCTIVNLTSMALYTGGVRVSYPYTFDNVTKVTNAISSTNTSLVSLATTWLPIIVVVLAAGIVLAILLGAFAGKRK